MIRRLLAIISALSLLALVGATAAWVLGLRWHARLESTRVHVEGSNWLQRHRLFSLAGRRLEWESDDIFGQNQQVLPDPQDGRWQFTFARRDVSDGTLLESHWPRWRSRSVTPTPGVREIVPLHYWLLDVPWWFLIAIAGVAPIVWLVLRYRRTRSASQTRCLACGYDLRASVGHCPECGTPIPAELAE